MDTSESDASYAWLPSMLQTVDPLFPIGSYAHSYGFEELAAIARFEGGHDLLEFLRSIVRLNLAQFELPYLRFACESLLEGDADGIVQIDREIGAAKLSSEVRRASEAQGRQRLRLLRELHPDTRFEALAKLAESGEVGPHHITVFAAERVQQNSPLRATLISWAYQSFAAPCAASLKIMRIGQNAAQSALTEALSWTPDIVAESLHVEREWAGVFNPVIDIAADRHERAYARLFIS